MAAQGMAALPERSANPAAAGRRPPPAPAAAGRHCAQVSDRIFVGSLAAAEDTTLMSSIGITHVLTVAPKQLAPKLAPRGRPCETVHRLITLVDHPAANLFDVLGPALAFIDSVAVLLGGRNKVLVHCTSGSSAAPAVCVAWLMNRQKMLYSEALAAVRMARPDAAPNCGFERQLVLLGQHACAVPAHQLAEAKASWAAAVSREVGASAPVRQERSQADLLHSAVDEAEAKLARFASAARRRRRAVEDSEVEDLELELEDLTRQLGRYHDVFRDKQAKSVWTGAKQKLVGLDEELTYVCSVCSVCGCSTAFCSTAGCSPAPSGSAPDKLADDDTVPAEKLEQGAVEAVGASAGLPSAEERRAEDVELTILLVGSDEQKPLLARAEEPEPEEREEMSQVIKQLHADYEETV